MRFLNAYWNVWQALAARADLELTRRHGLDLRAFIALSYIGGDVSSPGELARAMGLPKYVITRTLDSLSTLEAITRSSDPQNARRHALESTAIGTELWKAALETLNSVTEPPLLALGPQLETVTSLLEQLFTLAQLPENPTTENQETS